MPLHAEPIMITDPGALRAILPRLSEERLLACDLEADSLHHYTEKVCLIQISTPHDSLIIDPLAVPDLSPLHEVMASEQIRKIFHGADYDIRSLHRDFSIEIGNLFDTMVACQFLGEKELGLAAVLKKRFGVELEKKYQKADWSKRPLDDGMIRYAVTDTGLLIELYRQLEAELRAKGRLSWVEEECALLSRVRVAERSDEPLFLRFKGAAKMDPRTLTVLEGLLRFRDGKARQRDLPPFKVIGNEVIRELAEKKPRTQEELKEVPALSPKIGDRYGREIVAVIAKGLEVPDRGLLRYPRQPRPLHDPRRDERLKLLKNWREKKAAELEIDGGIMANGALLEALAEKTPRSREELERMPGVKNWQREEFGAEWLALLAS